MGRGFMNGNLHRILKVKLPVCVKYYAMKTSGRSGDIAPPLLS
jgi:hypothetical protein